MTFLIRATPHKNNNFVLSLALDYSFGTLALDYYMNGSRTENVSMPSNILISIPD